MRVGLAAHGIDSSFGLKAKGPHLGVDFVVMWGFKPPEVVRELREKNIPTLIMERGYLPSRMTYSSLGWNGLNNRATFTPCQDNGERLDKHWPGLVKPWRAEGGSYVLLCGQVPGDSSLYGMNLDAWAQQQTAALIERGHKVVYRPHPLVVRQQRINCPRGAHLSSLGPLDQDLSGAKFAVTYNSNVGVECVYLGTATVTLDAGAMAWPVTSHSLDEPLVRPDRTKWLNRLAWCNWKIEEIADGTAWDVISQARAAWN